MKRFIGLGVAAVAGIALTVLFSVAGGSPTSVSADGVGGTISLGTVSGVTVPVNTTAPTNPFNGFNVHIAVNVGAGATLTSIGATVCTSTDGDTGDCLANPSILLADSDASGGVDASSVLCPVSSPVPEDKVMGCIPLSGQSITTAGLLATFTINATGDGCVTVSLVTLPTTDDAYAANGTFTIADSAAGGPQAVNVDTATTRDITINGGGVCPGAAAATSTPTATNTLAAATFGPTSTPTPCPGVCPTFTPTLTPGLQIEGTLTPTGTPPTSTPAGSTTEAAAPTTAPAGSTPPDSGTGAGAGSPRSGITLPDTGSGQSADDAWTWIILSIAAAAIGMSALGFASRKSL